jgi:two-component system phosphate regulon sensor histidine kinase PhoR
MWNSPHYRRLFLSALATFAAVILALTLYAINRVHQIRYESQQAALLGQSSLVHALIKDDLRQGRRDAVQAHLRPIGEALGCRVTVIAEDGCAVADTEADPAAMEDHRLRPEIVAAAAHGDGAAIRYSHTVQQELIYLARQFKDEDGRQYYVRLAVPVDVLTKGLKAFDTALFLAGGVALLLAAFACYRLARRQTQPVVALAAVADGVMRGETARRFHPEPGGELGTLTRALNAMAESLEQARSQAAKGRDELETMLGSMSDGLIATDRQQRILMVNPAAGVLFGFDPAHAVGKTLWEVVSDEEVLKAATGALNSGERADFQGGPVQGRNVAGTLSPLLHQGRAEGLLLVARDTTQMVKYQELRKEFVANVSHELRTPLTLIKGFVETLSDGALADPVKGPEFLRIIGKHVNQLTNLVDDLLEISKLEGRAGLGRRAAVQVGATARKVVELMAPAAEKKGQRLSVEGAAQTPPIAADPDYIERAITNLVDNAIKYTPEGGTITVTTGAGEDSVVVAVRDSGIGIPETDLPRIFERFYRVDKSRSREMGGTGLGLAIVKHIAQAHGGKVEVESKPGQGSTFRIVLPAG